MHITDATPGGAKALTDLHLDVWEEAYTGLVPAEILTRRRADRAARSDGWRRILSSDATTEWVARDDPGDGRLLGFASTGEGRDEPEPGLPRLELMALYVRAEAYGAGIGYALCTRAVGEAPAYLWVLDGNQRAIRFYERQGFVFDGKRKTESEGVERRMVRGQGWTDPPSPPVEPAAVTGG